MLRFVVNRVLWIIPVLGVLVLVHEWGHFMAARLNGVRPWRGLRQGLLRLRDKANPEEAQTEKDQGATFYRHRRRLRYLARSRSKSRMNYGATRASKTFAPYSAGIV